MEYGGVQEIRSKGVREEFIKLKRGGGREIERRSRRGSGLNKGKRELKEGVGGGGGD